MKLWGKYLSFGCLAVHSIKHSNNHDTTTAAAALAMMVPHVGRRAIHVDNSLLSPVFWKSRLSVAFSPPSSLFYPPPTRTATTMSTRRRMKDICVRDDKDDNNQHPIVVSKSPFESFEDSVQQRIDMAEDHTYYYQNDNCKHTQQHSIPSMIVTMSELRSAANNNLKDPPIIQGCLTTNNCHGKENQTTTINDNDTSSNHHHHTRTNSRTNTIMDDDSANTCSNTSSSSTDSNTNVTMLTRHDIVSIMQQNGGCLVIQLEDNATTTTNNNNNHNNDTSLYPHWQIITDMWACTTMFHHSEQDPTTTQTTGMRHQTLEGSHTANQSQGGGYSHIETRIKRSDGSMIGLPPQYAVSSNTSNHNDDDDDDDDETSLGSSKLLQSGIVESYQLLSSIGKLVGSIGLSSSLLSSTAPTPEYCNDHDHDNNDDISAVKYDTDLYRKAQHMVNVFCDDGTDIGFENETDESCSVHRLCQYGTTITTTKGIPGNNTIKNNKNKNNDDDERVENLRSHTDWTLVTLVPVSTIVGLEIWNPLIHCWITPERIAKEHYSRNRNATTAATIEHHHHHHQYDQNNTTQNNDDEDKNWNSNYIVVMGGKWLELLTQGNVQSAIHRVVTRPKTNRLPKEQGHQSKEGRLSAPFFLRPRQKIPMDLQRYHGVNATKYNNYQEGSSNSTDHDNDYMKVLHDFLLGSCSGCLT